MLFLLAFRTINRIHLGLLVISLGTTRLKSTSMIPFGQIANVLCEESGGSVSRSSATLHCRFLRARSQGRHNFLLFPTLQSATSVDWRHRPHHSTFLLQLCCPVPWGCSAFCHYYLIIHSSCLYFMVHFLWTEQECICILTYQIALLFIMKEKKAEALHKTGPDSRFGSVDLSK